MKFLLEEIQIPLWCHLADEALVWSVRGRLEQKFSFTLLGITQITKLSLAYILALMYRVYFNAEMDFWHNFSFNFQKYLFLLQYGRQPNFETWKVSVR